MYYMDPSRSGRYAVRRALGLLLLMGGMMLLLFLVMGLFANGGIGGIFSSILRSSSHLFLLILAMIFGIRWVQERNLASARYYVLDDHFVGEGIDRSKLNMGNRRGVSKGERYGGSVDKQIRLAEVKSIQYKRNGIVVTAHNHDFLTGKGRVVILAEVGGYEQIKQTLQRRYPDRVR